MFIYRLIEFSTLLSFTGYMWYQAKKENETWAIWLMAVLWLLMDIHNFGDN